MKRRVVWSPPARQALLDIIGYIADDDPDAAARVAGGIEQVAAALGDFASGRKGRVPGTFEQIVSGLPYIIAYEVFQLPNSEEVVAILHVIHGARDWPAGTWPRDP